MIESVGPFRRQLVALAQNAIVLDELTFTWFGQRVRVPLRSGVDVLSDHLAKHLYSHFYTVGGPIPWVSPTPEPDRTDETFVEGISAAVSALRRKRSLPYAMSPPLPGSSVDQDGVTYAAPAGPSTQKAPLSSGRAPALVRRVQPGFCAVLGSVAQAENAPLMRFYWNVVADGAAPLAEMLGRELDAYGVPFALKLRDAPWGYTRRDAAVLFVPGEAVPAALDVIARHQSGLNWALSDGVPALTKRLATGIGAAEDPGTGESFGQHRCRVLTAALCDPAVRHARGAESRADAISAHLEAAGVSPSAPYLSRGGPDLLSLPPTTVSTTNSTRAAKRAPRRSALAQPIVAATGIGDLLVQEALWQGEACTWFTPRPGPNPSSPGPSPGRRWVLAGGDLFGGTAGIGTFLATLSATVCDARLERAAVGALRYAADAAERDMRPEEAALHLGWSGVALSLLDAGRRLERAELVDRGEQLARRLVRQELEHPDNDWLHGLAGTITGLLALHRAGVDGPFLEVADRLGQVMLSRSVLTPRGRTWGSRGRALVPLTGLAHGAAGIALALAELAAATGSHGYREATAEVVAYERRHFSPSRLNWPDFRLLPTGATSATRGRRYALAWCHGAPGIALARLRTWQLLGDEGYRDETAVGGTSARRSIGWLSCAGLDQLPLCHGLAGNLSIVRTLDAAIGAGRRVDPQEEDSFDAALSQLCTIAELARIPGPTSLWMRSTPSLFTGVAGIGQALLGEAHIVGAGWPMLPV